jgi:hypothetical protein
MSQEPPSTPGQPARYRSTRPEGGVDRLRVGAVIAVALVVAFAAWLIFRDGDDDPAPPEPASAAASVAQLRTLPDQTGHEIYWVGRRRDYTYELTRTKDGNVYVRYLPPGVPVGADQPEYLTVGTYPRRGALRDLRRLARRQTNVSFPLNNGGIAVYSRSRPTSVYLAYPGERVQVEVYDPSPQRARRLARDERVRPIQ